MQYLSRQLSHPPAGFAGIPAISALREAGGTGLIHKEKSPAPATRREAGSGPLSILLMIRKKA